LVLKPKAMLTQTNPTIKTPANVSELITKKGIHIYAKNCIIALKFEKIVNKHLIIWTDQGIIDLPLEQRLKVPLVNG
jgi:hypothetical protein